MGGFDELIERLLYDVALSGSEGFDAHRFENAVRAFYEEKNETNEGSDVEPQQNSLFADAPPNEKTAVDEKLLASVLEWLCRHPEVELRHVPQAETINKATQDEAATSPVTLKLAGKRIFTTEDRIWHAIAGHGPDLRRIPQLEFDILSIVAAHNSTGILQPHITRKTGQDKRSVPKRTDRLQEKGYITKETVIGNTGKTSLLKLKRFSKMQSLERPLEETATNNSKPIIHYDRMYNTLMRMLQENEGTVTMADLRIGLGIEPGAPGRPQAKIFARCVRRLEEGGCIRRVTAKMVDAEGNAMDTIGHQHWRRAKAVQLMRPPTQYDRLLWEQSDPQMKTTASDEEEEREDAIAAIDAAIGSDDDEEEGPVEVGDIEEVATSAEQLQALGEKTIQAEAAQDNDDDLNDLDRLMDRVPPQWTPNVPLVNLLFNKIDGAGEAGISTNQLQAAIVGPLWKRPMDELLSHLTDIWQHSQPPHLRHLTVVRDTAVFGRSAQFKYRTLANFEKAVAAGKAVWTAVLDNTSAKAKKDPLQEKPDLDSWGFPKVPSKLLAGRDGRATLAEGRKGCQVERMTDMDAEQDDLVADDDEGEAPVRMPANKASHRKRKSSAQYQSTATLPPARSPRSFNGFTVNGKKMGRRSKKRSESRDQEEGPIIPSASATRTAAGVDRVEGIIQDAPQQSRSSAARGRATENGGISGERLMSTSAERPNVRRTYLHSKAYTLKHPEIEWVHRGQGRYSRASDVPEAVMIESGAEKKSNQRPVTSTDYLPHHRPREVTEEEIKQYEEFARRSAENRVRLEVNAARKRNADAAGLTTDNSTSKKLRAETGEGVRTVSFDGNVSNITTPVPADQLSSARIEAVKEELLARQKPGIYINPPGAKETKAVNFPSRGRPRKAKIAVFKSERLHEFEWYEDGQGPRFAPPKPLGRTRTASIGSGLKISASIIENSDSDSESDLNATNPVHKRQRTTNTLEPQVVGSRASRPRAHGFPGDSPTFDTGTIARDIAADSVVLPAQSSKVPPSAGFPGAHLSQAVPSTVVKTPQANGSDPQSKDIDADNAAFYLARYKKEERDTPLQQYTRLLQKPGRKSKKDLDVLAILERVVGPQPRPRTSISKLQPTEIPNPVTIAEARQQLQISLDQGLHMGDATTTTASTGGSKPVNTAQSVTIADDESSDDSETDDEDWATPQLAAIARNQTSNTANTSEQLTLEQAMQQAVMPQPVEAARRALPKSAASNEYFSSAYVNTHPDEIFYHAGGGRWKRGKPPPGHYTQTWRGPGAPEKLAPLSQLQMQQSTTPKQASSQGLRGRQKVSRSSSSNRGVDVPSQSAQMSFSPLSRIQPPTLHVARPYMTTPAPKSSPLTIVRPYETPIVNSQERKEKLAESTDVPVPLDEEGADETMVDDDIIPELQEPDDPDDRTFGGEDEMDIDVTEEVDNSVTELGVPRALKPISTQKKTGGVKFGGSTQVKRHEIILSALRQCGGVFPGDQEMWYVLATAWKKLYDRLPDRHTVEHAVEQLMSEKKLKRFQFKFKSKRSAIIVKQILAEPSINATDAVVTQLRKLMMKTYPLQHLPSEVDIDDEFRESAGNRRRRRTKNGDVTLSEPRPADFPEDPVLIVKQTAMAAAKADEDAQRKGFANAQMLRQHMQELNQEAKRKAWQKRTDMQRKEQRAIAAEEQLIAADLAIEEAEILDADAGEEQTRGRGPQDSGTGELPYLAPAAEDPISEEVELLNANGKRRRRRRDPETGELLPLAPLTRSLSQKTQGSQARQSLEPTILDDDVPGTQLVDDAHDNGIAIQTRDGESETPVLRETHFEHYVPPAKPTRPARKPLGSTRGPAVIREKPHECIECGRWFARRDNLTAHQRTHGPGKRWYDHEKRLRAATLAHLFSPAQTFTPSNGTFGTSGCGITQHVMNLRLVPGTLTLEEYQAETARNIARIKRYAQNPAADDTIQQDEPVGAQKGSTWSKEEDATMIRLKEVDGLSWREIVAQLPGRTENSARFRYSAVFNKNGYIAPPTRIVKFNVPKDKLNAIISAQPKPASVVRKSANDNASVFEVGGTPSSPAMSPDPEAEPPRKRRKYASRKKKQVVDDGAMDESDDDFVPGADLEFVDDRKSARLPKLKGPGIRGVKKPFTTRDRQAHAGFKDVDRLVVAVALISAIAGGLSQEKMNWSLIAHALSYRYEGEFLRRRWDHYRGSRKADADRIRDAIRQPFLEAYEKDELPVVNLQAAHETDWPALFDWVLEKIPMKMSVTVEEQPDAPDLPATKELLGEKFTVNMREPVFELNRDDYFTTITDQNRRHIAQRVTLGDMLPGEVRPCEVMNNELLLAKSWVRAVAMTKQHKYVPELAAKKISVLGNRALKKVSTDLVEAKIFLQDKRGRQLPGRNFQIHHEVLVQFRRWPATREIDEHRYLCALAESWVGINDYFKQADELLLTPVTSDQDYTILTNLVATGMVTIRPVLPEVKWEFDAPQPRLSPWGYSGNSYQTKNVDPDQLKYDLVYTKTEHYKYDHELNTDVPVPTVPSTIEGEFGPRIPFWVDIHGNLIDDIWDMCLRSILHLVVFRSGIRAVTMQLAHSHKLWQWEIGMIIDWMEKVGLAVRCGDGEEINGIWNGGWTAGKWWFCAFLPEMIQWTPPLPGGLMEVG